MSTKEKNSNSVSQVVVKKVIHADRNRVFDAWTKPEIMNQWYVGNKGKARTAVDLRVGGKYINEMLIEDGSTCSCQGSVTVGSTSYLHHGEYLEIDRPHRLVFTWNSPSVQNTKVTVELREVSEGTEVTIIHELLSPENCEGHTTGWTFALSNLDTFLG